MGYPPARRVLLFALHTSLFLSFHRMHALTSSSVLTLIYVYFLSDTTKLVTYAAHISLLVGRASSKFA
jgi:hypothetical protein